MSDAPEHTLEFLLAFDGRVHWLEQGYSLKFAIRRVAPTKDRPHGLNYSFTLHDLDGKRLVGFDNAHSVPARGSRFKKRPAAADHWHRTEGDEGRHIGSSAPTGCWKTSFAKRGACWTSGD